MEVKKVKIGGAHYGQLGRTDSEISNAGEAQTRIDLKHPFDFDFPESGLLL